ncbi:MAG: glycosyltransferase 87 family protein [Actinomycetota bacterium]|nr:glycosyltransferase 87 family protein [Actinomycetota bacterium]
MSTAPLLRHSCTGTRRGTLGFGQINMVLVALVVADCTGVIARRFRGVGIGIAAAIKITPAAFGLLLVLRKDYSSAVRSAGAFLMAAAIGGVFAPRDSNLFWTQVFFDTNRAGAPWYGPNQAITGPLTRLGLTGTPETLAWILGAVLIVGAATYAARQFTRTGEHVAALGVIALASLLAAPFAVSHHWSYVIILLPLLMAAQYRRWRYLLAGATMVFLLGAQWYLPIGDDRELHWTVLQQVVGDSECLVGIALLVGAVIAARSRARAGPAPLTDVTAVEAGSVDATSAAR